ncbi:type I-F CRISPR-associated protein Csy2 [Serratia rubidaea]|uniref:type I-F CRISPR-associated protein Csy2 n=1 Tax=Serratia rubidaea TaxID=61652 RepID=UPI00234BCFF8|nr:type I-F CRISPR-associated protein Csy2 [Serratia rubidaea]MDC6120931.1 type I-F CRISPR-associated protein Csy2 [Serratia rubidaea]MEB7586891.1 type I-F CRISPR-associated protein Csy2 [Serratia rubidaea]
MSSLIVLRHVRVENANAIAGLTYGFPAISHFLGFTHALSRKLQHSRGLTLDNCGVVCHQQHLQAYSSGYDKVFALTRNPLTKEAKTAAFNEEGRMHLTVSLVMECSGVIDGGEAGAQALADELQRLSLTQRLAGGTIVDIGRVSVLAYPATPAALRRITRRLLPGFTLLDRSELLYSHYQTLRADDPQAEMLDAWLDFAALKQQAEGDEQSERVEWRYLPKPAAGYLVPLQTGYRAISPLYAPGEVKNTRDAATPFRFAEALYGVGEWRSLHRISDLPQMLWQYHHEDDCYLCRGVMSAQEEYAEFNEE